MTQQDFEDVVKIIGDDPKYRHFVNRIKKILATVSDTDNAALEFYRKSGAEIIHDFSARSEGISAAFMVWRLE